ncbi:MAG: AsmA family protein [Alphaproteobacteria bacterium]|nr:AsmA family protein [Alphaproteobacteria bacterium]
MRFWTILKIAVVLGGTVILVMAGLVAGTDVNAYKRQISAAIEAETGRKIVFGGDIVLSLGSTTTLTINDVQLANIDGGSGPDMLRVDEATAVVDAWRLRRGEVVIQRLILRGADVRIDIDKQGRTNFDFGRGESAPAGKNHFATSNGKSRGALLQHLGDIDIYDTKVTVRDGRTGQTQKLSLQRLNLGEADRESLIRIAARGRLDAGGKVRSFDLEGRAGRLADLVVRDGPYPVEVRGVVDGVELAAAGTIADPFAATGLSLHVDLSAKELKPFESLLGVELPPIGPARLAATLTGTSEIFLLSDLSFELADSRLTGDLLIDLSKPELDLEGNLAATWLDLGPWLTSESEMAPRHPARLLNDDRIDFAALIDFNGRLSLKAEALVASDLLFRDVALTFDFKDGQLKVSPAEARFDARTIDGTLRVDARAHPPATALQLSSREADIGRLLARIFDDEFVHGIGGMDLAINGRGWTLAEIVGSSSGHLRVLMEGGEVKTGSLDLLVGGLSELLPGLGSGNAGWTAINCVAGDFDLQGGVATSRVALLDSEVLRLVGKGQIDLSHDTLEFYVSPSAKSVTLNVAVPVNLTGPLEDPSITPDELSILARIGGLVGAVIFPPAALLSLGSLGSHDNPCLEAVQAAEVPAPPEEPADFSGQPEADLPPEAGGESSERLIDAVKQLLPLRDHDE